ncbi:MAG: arginine deiminase family protein [Actinomycetota bacterium]
MTGHAFLREVPDSFVRCITAAPVSPPLDPRLARRQHRAYREALEAGGFGTSLLTADEVHPDGSFIEDAAVVLDERALATRPGHPSRRGEVAPVAAALAEIMPVLFVEEPGCLDGGDVLTVGDRVFVGISGRTNRDGIDALARFAGPRRRVVPVEVTGVLHLKSAVTALDERTLLMEPGRVDPMRFDGLDIVLTAPGEDHAANVVRLADGRILMGAASPETADRIVAAGFEVVAVDVSEFGRADGGLTCLSIRIRPGLASSARILSA